MHGQEEAAPSPKQSMKLPTITISLIAKNEAHNLDDFYKSIAPIADELVVAYTPSTDDSWNKLKELKERSSFPVIIFEYKEMPFHYGHARNATIEQATSEYVCMLDGDERLSPGFVTNVKEFLAEKKPDVVSMQREDDLTPHLIDPQTRILRRDSGIKYNSGESGRIHEHLLFSVPAVRFDQMILHQQGKKHWLNSHTVFLRELVHETHFEENTRGLPREIFRGFKSGFYKFRTEYFRKQAYKDGRAGLKYAFLRSFQRFMTHILIGLKPRVKKK